MLRLPSLIALALLVFSSSSFAQEKEDYNALNQKVIEALKAKKYDEGIAILTRMLDVGTKDQRKGTAYNFACAYALKGEPDKAFEWLGKSVDWGWGQGQGQLVGAEKPQSEVEMTKADPDLESLRKDPRYAKLIERMEKAGELRNAALKKGEEYSATAAVYIPEKTAALKEMPILVVLHDAGSTKDEVVRGRWKDIADELGFALIAPTGKFPVGDDPAKGTTWFETIDDYAAKYYVYEKPVNDAVVAFKKDHPIDKAQVVVVGEGLGGLVALDVAINGPGLYKGVVSLNGAFRPEILAGRAPAAAKMGLRAELLIDTSRIPKDAAPEGGALKIAEAQNKSLQSWGLAGEAKAFTPDPKDSGDKKVLVEAIRSSLARPATEAAAPKK
jgi:predicted esterase